MRIKYIDVLKAFAIIAVVLYHSGFMTYGYLGVDLFLVISGYLTTKSLYSKLLMDRKLSGGGKFYIDFEISRVVRLLPPLLAAGAFCMLLGYFVMLPDDYENLSESVIASNVFGNNILSAITTNNYWDVVNEFKPLMHTWYVGLVMQFYIVYPVLFFLARLDKKSLKASLLTMIGVLAVVSLLVYFGTEDAAKRFYYLPSRFFEFAVGGVVALTYNPKDNKPFRKGFVYVCYALVLLLMAVNAELMPANIRLVTVVALSAVLLCSKDDLENKVTGNKVLASIGAASYSIFIWHQVILAFCRYSITSWFTVTVYLLILAATAVLSFLSYRFIEQVTSNALKTRRGKIIFYAATISLFVLLNSFAFIIYRNAGVVRDVPELYISMQNKHRGMHAEYVDRAKQFDKLFTTDKAHWLVIGNSFGRDFVNVILESSIADSVEVSYSTSFKDRDDRIADADLVFLSTLGLDEKLVTELEIHLLANGLTTDQLVIVGEKNFGVSNGQVYAKRNQTDYFDQYVEVEDKEKYIVRNERFANLYGDRYLDLMKYVSNENNQVRIFTPDHHFISADCRHFSKGGAAYLAKYIEWNKYLYTQH